MTANRLKTCVVRICLCIIVGMIMAGCAGRKMLVKSFEPENIMHYSDLTQLEDTKSINHIALFIEKGESIPLTLSMDTDFMAIKQEQIDLIAKRKLYFMVNMPADLSEAQLAELSNTDARTVSKWSPAQRSAFLKNFKLFLSTDAIHWAPITSRKARRQVLGYKAGMLSLGMQASTTRGLGASLHIKTVR